MKKLSFFFLSLISYLCAFADDDISLADYHAKIDSLFEHLDCSTVETGILIDHGFCPIPPKAFNGHECDSVSSNKEILKILYSELADSKVNGNCQMEAVDAIHSEIDSTKNISILYYAYNNFYELAINSGKIYVEDQQIKIDENKPDLVFDYNYCFAIALGVTEFSNKAISIPITIGKLISNLSPRIVTIEIKADNGSFEKVAINATWNHTFSTLGEHALYFRILFDDGNLMTCRTTITVSESSGRQAVAPMDKSVESFLTIDADYVQSGGEIQVMYLDREKTGGKFIRPLVIAGDIDFSKILSDTSNSFDLATLDRKSNIGEKINELSKIFDIIYIKYNNDTDDLLRNGILFRRAIEAINANKFTFCDKTYVVGIGTGGVIARIGINMMEKDSVDHNICKFIAVNSPFRGVNIPLSIQSLMRHVSKTPTILKWLIATPIKQAKRFNDYLKTPAMNSLTIQRIEGEKTCTNNSNWLTANAKYLAKPKNCQSVAIASADSSVSPSNDFFSITSKLYLVEAGWKVDLKGYSANSSDKIYDGRIAIYTTLLSFPAWKTNKYKVSGNNSVLPIDYCRGAKVSAKQFEGRYSIAKVSFPMSKFTITPCYSALDMTMAEFNSLTSFPNVKSSKFDKCHVVTTECTYPNVSPLLSALAEELTPRIEGNTYSILGTTELTLENVPNISIIKYNWETANNNFKVISSSKNKAIITPTKYSTRDQSISDVITVRPKSIIPFDSDILSSLKLSTNISAASLSIKGSDYISTELNVYELAPIPQDVTTVEWTASDGITLTPYDDKTVGAKIKKALDNNWISCSFKSYGINHEIKKSLKVATLDSAKMTILKHWYDPNEQIDKYYFHIDVFPANVIGEMYYCWSNTVSVSKKSSNLGLGIGLSGVAKIKTEGDVGTCKVVGPVTIKPGTILKPKIINDATINGLDESVIEPAIMGKFEAIVSMPKITTSEVASGKIKCYVSDYFGHSVTLSEDVESKWATAYCVAPNPANNILSISKTNDDISVCDLAQSATARLYDDNSLIREWVLSSDNKTVSISDIPNGTYFLNIEENGTIVYKQTIIIKH